MSTLAIEEVEDKARAAKAAAQVLATAGTAAKNTALEAMAEVLAQQQDAILEANARDIAGASERGPVAALY